MGRDIVDCMSDIVVSLDNIVESIKRLKVNSAAGPDFLPAILLKSSPTSLQYLSKNISKILPFRGFTILMESFPRGSYF